MVRFLKFRLTNFPNNGVKQLTKYTDKILEMRQLLCKTCSNCGYIHEVISVDGTFLNDTFRIVIVGCFHYFPKLNKNFQSGGKNKFQLKLIVLIVSEYFDSHFLS